MDSSLGALINLYVFSTGRRLFAFQQMRKVAVERKFDALLVHVDRAIEQDRATRTVEVQWAAEPAAPKANPELQRLDVKADRALVAIRDATQAHIDGAEEGDTIAVDAQALLKAIYPAGVQAVTQATYVDELAAIDGVVSTLKSKRFAGTVTELGLDRLVKRLAKLAGQYRAALEAKPVAGASFGEVRAARATGQQNLLQAVAMILGKYPGASADDMAARDALLAPVLEQNEAIRQYLRSRRAVPDVNPETGKDDPSAPAPVEPPAAAPNG